MFLEETIESLDTEEDSGLSNDEPDQVRQHSGIATKLADLSASMSSSKINRESMCRHRCRISSRKTIYKQLLIFMYDIMIFMYKIFYVCIQ